MAAWLKGERPMYISLTAVFVFIVVVVIVVVVVVVVDTSTPLDQDGIAAATLKTALVSVKFPYRR